MEVAPISCGACVCFVPNDKTMGRGGECHRFPPAVVVTRTMERSLQGMMPKDHINTVFTPVPTESWCAEFRQRPPDPAITDVASSDAKQE